jgi:hypothetical protein
MESSSGIRGFYQTQNVILAPIRTIRGGMMFNGRRNDVPEL